MITDCHHVEILSGLHMLTTKLIQFLSCFPSLQFLPFPPFFFSLVKSLLILEGHHFVNLPNQITYLFLFASIYFSTYDAEQIFQVFEIISEKNKEIASVIHLCFVLLSALGICSTATSGIATLSYAHCQSSFILRGHIEKFCLQRHNVSGFQFRIF